MLTNLDREQSTLGYPGALSLLVHLQIHVYVIDVISFQCNQLCVWSLDERTEPISSEEFVVDIEPRLLCQVEHNGDVTDLIVWIQCF